jgi:hypothetical protein
MKIVRIAQWTGNNLDEIKEFCPKIKEMVLGDCRKVSVGDYVVQDGRGGFHIITQDMLKEAFSDTVEKKFVDSLVKDIHNQVDSFAEKYDIDGEKVLNRLLERI